MSTFKNLQDRVAAILYNRTDLSTYVPQWITQAQRKLERENWRCMEKHSYTENFSDEKLPVPSNYKEAIMMRVLDNGNYYEIEHMDLVELYLKYGDNTTQTGMPEVYATNTATPEFLLAPTPDKGYTLDFHYYANLAALSADADTNWWTTNAEELLVYGALIEGVAFLPNDDRLQVWSQLYQDAYQRLKQQETKEQYSGSSLYLRADYVI